MSEELQEIAQQAAFYKALQARVTRWSDEADRLLVLEDRGLPASVRALLKDVAEAGA